MGGGGSNKIDETAEQRELARIAAEQYEYFERELMPVRDSWMADMVSNNDESNFERLAGTVSTDAATVLQREQDGGVQQLAAQGVDPTSGKFQSTVGKMAAESGRIMADTTNRAQVAQQDAYVDGLGSVIAMGEKKAAQATAGLSDVAAKSADHARQSAEDSLRRRASAGTGLGLVAGAAADMYSGREGS